MIKYLPEMVQILFSECPNEISLGINITNCQFTCKGCHSPELRTDQGAVLTPDILVQLMDFHKGISAVCFLGEGNDIAQMVVLLQTVKQQGLKTCMYTAHTTETIDRSVLPFLDYVKVGAYSQKLGNLRSESTNQRFFTVKDGIIDQDITSIFFKKVITTDLCEAEI